MASKTRACQCCRPRLKQPPKGGRTKPSPSRLLFKYLCLRLLSGLLVFCLGSTGQTIAIKISLSRCCCVSLFFSLQPPLPPSHRPPSNLIFSRDWVPSSSARALMTFLLKPFPRKLLYCFRTVGWVCVQEFDPSSALARRKVIESWSLCSKRNLNDGPR